MGSKLGWILAGGLVVAALIAFVAYNTDWLFSPDPEEPTKATTAPGVLDLHVVSAPVTNVIPSKPSGPGNAAEDYVTAGKIAIDNESTIKDYYKNAIKNGTSVRSDIAAKMEAIRKAVADGASKKNFDFAIKITGDFEAAPPADFWENHVKPLNRISELLSQLSAYHVKQGNYDKAVAVQQLVFTMGWHMTTEHVRVFTISSGLFIQQTAIKKLIIIYKASKITGKESIITDLTSYKRDLDKVKRTFDKKMKIVRVVSPKAGDIFNIIENDKDRAWRVEGLLILGAYKKGEAHHEGNKLKTQQLLEEFSSSDDPFEKAAALRASNFTDADADAWGFVE